MSRFSSTSSGITLDAAGNIDTRKLEKELRSALDFDIKYKQTDNMKKKACKVSGTYDEFKAMVACAHLKTLTSKEVQSLATAKKGWQKAHVADTSTAAVILQQEQRELEAAAGNSQGGSSSDGAAAAVQASESNSIIGNAPGVPSSDGKLPIIVISPTLSFARPKNGLAMERDMRKLHSVALRWSYLRQVGLKRIKTLLKGDAGIEIFECALICVMSSAAAGVEADTEVGAAHDDGRDVARVFKWLKAISAFDRFSVSIHFIPQPLVQEIKAWLAALCETSEGEAKLDVVAVQAMYSLA